MKQFIIEHVDPIGTAIVGVIAAQILDTIWLKPGTNDWSCTHIWLTLVLIGSAVLWALGKWEERQERRRQIEAELHRNLMLHHGRAIQHSGQPAPWHQ